MHNFLPELLNPHTIAFINKHGKHLLQMVSWERNEDNHFVIPIHEHDDVRVTIEYVNDCLIECTFLYVGNENACGDDFYDWEEVNDNHITNETIQDVLCENILPTVQAYKFTEWARAQRT